MTVALGLVCSDGVIVASDSMGSNEQIAAPVVKVYNLENLPIIWTASGPQYVIEEIKTALSELDSAVTGDETTRNWFLQPVLESMRRNLKGRVHHVLQECYKSALPLQEKQVVGKQHVFHTDTLILGYTNEVPYFLEFAGDGQINWHMTDRFYAVGSGGPFASVALGLMQHYLEEGPLPVELGLQVAYRAIETTCRVSSMLVGMPVQLAVADDKGSRVLTEDDRDKVATAVGRWQQVEREALREPPPMGSPPDELPAMEDGGEE